MGKTTKLPDEIDKKIDRAITKILNACAEKMANDCREQYEKIIDNFYADYRPHSYNRTLETKYAHNLYRNNYKSITTFIDSNTVQIIFSPGSEYIEGNPYRANKDWVYERTYIEGIHGWTPEEVLEYSSGANYGYYGKHGDFFINKMLNYMPEPMSPSPKECIDEWYKKYKTPTNLRRILQPIAKKILNESI